MFVLFKGLHFQKRKRERERKRGVEGGKEEGRKEGRKRGREGREANKLIPSGAGASAEHWP